MAASLPLSKTDQDLYAAIKAYLDTEDFKSLETAVNQVFAGWAGFFIALESSKTNVQRFAAMLKVFKDAGWLARQPSVMVQLLKALFGDRQILRASIIFLDAMANSSSKIRALAKTMATFGKVIAWVTLVVKVTIPLLRGEWGPAAAEIFKFVVGAKLPYLAVVDAIEDMVTQYNPDLKGHVGWRIVRALNPLAAGGAGVDALVTLAQNRVVDQLVSLAVNKRLDPAKFEAGMRALDARMRDGGMRWASEIGDNLAGAIDQMSSITPQQILSDLWLGATDMMQNGVRR